MPSYIVANTSWKEKDHGHSEPSYKEGLMPDTNDTSTTQPYVRLC